MTSVKKPKSEGIALLISVFLAGIGEIYLGKIGRGIAIFVGGIAIGSITSYSFGYLFGNPLYGLIFSLAFWIWQMYDTHKVYEQFYRQIAK